MQCDGVGLTDHHWICLVGTFSFCERTTENSEEHGQYSAQESVLASVTCLLVASIIKCDGAGIIRRVKEKNVTVL